MIYTWAVAQAEAEKILWQYFHRSTKEWGCECCNPWDKERDFRHEHTDADWLNTVLERIGWSMSEAKHTPTPTPWHASKPSGSTVLDKDGHLIAMVAQNAKTEANAAFIVRAVNANGSLIAALEKLMNEANGFVSMADPANHGNTNIAVLKLRIDEARAALAKAKAYD